MTFSSCYVSMSIHFYYPTQLFNSGSKGTRLQRAALLQVKSNYNG